MAHTSLKPRARHIWLHPSCPPNPNHRSHGQRMANVGTSSNSHAA
eukprot:CAMPEP_0181173822 /NCGR_PEP_ID=MMETSP1096-20121128/3203_1 /TAXON_ID=156174 ORGANISM="Chrysochromulina ericina, Strain CCMP281" /NCGR_SAMPLE_ID=MMETSP1096 /ASSEMBLY_ACC=CAM_ASM_000453 /LENGTH=44 /DNA_ID=CAMNT_0023261673 /DNA_START=105 /DNA_END=239 /DNA_ORIENTATION=+